VLIDAEETELALVDTMVGLDALLVDGAKASLLVGTGDVLLVGSKDTVPDVTGDTLSDVTGDTLSDGAGDALLDGAGDALSDRVGGALLVGARDVLLVLVVDASTPADEPPATADERLDKAEESTEAGGGSRNSLPKDVGAGSPFVPARGPDGSPREIPDCDSHTEVGMLYGE
jgi:hypothetical protein